MRYVNLLVGANEELVILESMVKVLPLSEYSWITYDNCFVGSVEYSDGTYMDVYRDVEYGLVGFEYEAE